MAKISQREKILLGYNSSNSNSMSNSSSRRNSEVDFSDVFGGPPRCSTQDLYQYEEDDSINCIDDDNDNDNGGELGDGLQVPWFGSTEKPVFGEQIGGRRRYTSEDFYGDIFGGDQPLLSCSLSPSRNPFSSAPGSRNMSPSRHPSPAVNSFADSSTFSLPGRMTNPDTLTSTSMNNSSKLSGRSLSRFNQTVQNHSVYHGYAPSFYQPSTLSREVSIDGKESSSDQKLDRVDYEEEFMMDSKDSEFRNENIQFHFSMYKWPSKGIPFVMSSRKRSTSRSKERSINNRSYLITSEAISKRRVPSTSQVKKEDIILHITSAECKSGNEIDQVVCDVTNRVEKAPSDGQKDTNKMSDHSLKSSEAMVDDISLKQSLKKTKSSLKSLGSLFGEEKKGKKKATPEKGGKKNKVNETKTSYINDSLSSYNINKGKEHSYNIEEKEIDEILSYDVNKSKVYKSSTRAKENNDISINNVSNCKVHMSSTGAKDDIYKGDGSGKVKDYVKIFNLDSSSTTKSNGVGKSRSWRWKNTTKFEAEKEVGNLLAKKQDEMQASYVNLEKTLSESIEVLDGASFILEEQVFTIDGNDRIVDSSTATSNDEPIIDNIEASTMKNDTFVDDILDKGIVQDINIQLETELQEEIKSYEYKVRQWSKGKEGNIRALISTMQYVLWPNSGWKPIPLVDIIEANAVKKAYQKALLCLHPDKLQQKGANPCQKLIAEKVFDILQESWDQFNAIGLIS